MNIQQIAQEQREMIADIIKRGVTYSGQTDSVVIHGAIDELTQLIESVRLFEREKVIGEIRNSFVSGMPVGDVTAWDLIQQAKQFNLYLESLRRHEEENKTN